jgi:cell division protein FtsB
MTFASVVSVSLLALFGAGIILAVCNARRLIAWENHALNALADSVRDYRLSLEEDMKLLEVARPQQARPAQRKPASQRGGKAA